MMHPVFAVFSPVLAAGAAVAAVAAPLLIHLLFRKRYQIVPWAAIRFLLTAERRHKRRIDQWLLLALRTFALLLPLFAMLAATSWAEDLWQRIQPGKLESYSSVPRTHHVLVIDGSRSMTTRTDDGRTRFERSIAAAEELIQRGNNGDGYSIVYLGTSPQVIVPGPSNAHDKVLKELSKLKPTHAATDTAPALPLIADALARSPRSYPRRQVTFFTDLQRSAWASSLPSPDAPVPEAWTQILKGKEGKGAAEVLIVDAAKADVDNLAIADLALADPLPLVDAPATVTATVQNHGKSEKRLVRVELLLGRPSAAGSDSLVSVESRTIDAVPAGGVSAVTFNLEGTRTGFITRGLHVVQVKLADGDELPADDARSLAVDVRAGLHAMIVDGKKGEAERLRRAGEHLARSLVPPGAKPTETPARLHRPGAKWPENPDDRWILSPTEFTNPDLGDPAGAECLFLCDVPALTVAMVGKLEAHLKRGGGVVIGLGPHAFAARDNYNKLLFNEGNGILPGPILDLATSKADDPGFRLFADEAEYRKVPLLAFRDDNARAGLATVPFRSYVKIDAPADGRARRILSFVPANAPADPSKKPDAAVVEWSRHRGRVLVYTSTFNQEWTDWPVLPSFLPFVHEVLRFASTNPDRHTIRVGDLLEEFFPPATAGLSAELIGPDGITAKLPITLRDEAGTARFPDTNFAGLYRLGAGEQRDRVFAVNPPEGSPSGGNEFDLRRAESAEFKPVGAIQIVSELGEARTADGGVSIVSTPRPHGPTLARWAVLIALGIMVWEVVLAWKMGPSRLPGVTARPIEKHPLLRIAGNVLALGVVAVVFTAVFLVIRADRTGNVFGFLPSEMKYEAESAVGWAVGLPPTPPGENDKLVLERAAAIAKDLHTDWIIATVLALGCAAIAGGMYWRERTVAGGLRRIILPTALRTGIFALALFVLLSQWQLAFKREGWPEIVILLDTSASMATADELRDPAVKAKAEQLAAGLNLSKPHRLKLAQLLLYRSGGPGFQPGGIDWLEKLLREKRVKVHVYAVDSQTRHVGSATEEKDIPAARDAMLALKPEGDTSRLGDGVEAVVRSYQGGSLAAIILFTDGVTTAGLDLPDAAKTANIPLYLVGMGDPWVVPDLRLSDPIFEEVVARGDTLEFQARLSSRGAVPPDSVQVSLFEKLPSGLVERGRAAAVPTEDGAAVKVSWTPTEVGEKILVLEVPPIAGEADTSNNRIERRVTVVDAKRARVLFVEGDPRYDFRYAKVLMERESERVAGNKSIELKSVLLGASRGWAETDKSALADFPTKDQLFEYDVVILGDFDPKQLPRTTRALQDLADFVKVKGGGVFFVAGEHFSPASFADTPLADVMPIVPNDGLPPKPTSEESPITESYRPHLTPAGRSHPLFRFHSDPAESERIWNRLQPLFWHATGYKRKPAAEVLAVHKDKPAEGGREQHPLVLQQFVGAGRVIFLGFDETWRWRFRTDEEQFNKFWLQAVRVLARARRGKIELKLKDGGGPYRRDDRIAVRVRFPDDAPAPPEGTVVRVQVQRTPLPNADGSPGMGEVESQDLLLTRVKGERAEFEGVLTRTPEAVYRFTLVAPDAGPNPPRAEAKVLPPPTERERLDMNRQALVAAAGISHGGFYTLDTAEKVFDDLRDLEPIELNEPRPPIALWNHPAVYGLLFLALVAEWLLRKRERLL